MPVLLTKMTALRKEVLVKIYMGLGQSTTDYPLMKALNEVDDYYNAGTIPGAIIGITATAGATIAKADEAISRARINEPWSPNARAQVISIGDAIENLTDFAKAKAV